MKCLLQLTRRDALYCSHQYCTNEQKGLAFNFLTNATQVSLIGLFTYITRRKIRSLCILKDHVQAGKTILVTDIQSCKVQLQLAFNPQYLNYL